MKISSRVDYAVSCAIRVAGRYKTKEPVPVAYVAQRERLEPDYVEQLLIKLKMAGIIRSVRGPGGGYILARPPAAISSKDIVEAIDGEVLELVCFRKKGRRNRCVHLRDCRVRDFWLGLKKAMEAFLSGYSLEDLAALRKKEKSFAV